MLSIPEGEVSRIALLRHYTKALDVGGLVLALSRHRVTDREPLFALRARQHSQLIDLLHAFAYNARKAIELAEEYAPGIVAHAQDVKLAGFAETDLELGLGGAAQPLADQSLWWILGRVIHSRDVVILELEDAEVGTGWAAAPNITVYWTPLAFAVRSDLDPADRLHYVRTERVVELFLSLADSFERALAAVRSSKGVSGTDGG